MSIREANPHPPAPGQPPEIVSFDDQMWPINCAILVLAGFVAGIVIATNDFADAHLLYNGWTRLVCVGLLLAVLFWGILVLQGKMRRRLQLAVLLSLLLHLGLAVYMRGQYLSFIEPGDALAGRPAEQSGAVLVLADSPDYTNYIAEPEQVAAVPEEAVQKPVDVPVPEEKQPEVARQEVTHEIPVEREAVAPRTPEPGPEPLPLETAGPAEPRRADPGPMSAPRRAEQAGGGQISRQPFRHLPQPGEPIPEPQVGPGGGGALPTIASREISVRRQEVAAVPRAAQSSAATNADGPLALGPAPGGPAGKPRRGTPDGGPRMTAQAPSPPSSRVTRADFFVDVPAAPTETPLAAAAAPAAPGDGAAPGGTVQKAATGPAVVGGPAGGPAAAPGVEVAALAASPQLPATAAHRGQATQQQPGGSAASPAKPSTLARATRGVNLPSAVVAGGDAAATAAAAEGGLPGSRIEATASTAVQRVAGSQAPKGPAIAASGEAEFGIGAGQVVARYGQPRGTGAGEPSVVPNGPAQRIARARFGSPVGGGAVNEIAAAPDEARGRGTGGGAPDVDAPVLAVARSGRGGLPAGVSAAAAGPIHSGAGGVGGGGIAQPRLATRAQAIGPGPIGVGGSPSIGRSNTNHLATTGTGIEAADAAVAAVAGGAPAVGGGPGGSRIESNGLEMSVGRQEPAILGLPGALQSASRAGAPDSFTDRGAPLALAAARRGTTSEPGPGGTGLSPGVSATIARSPRGSTSLPAAAVPIDAVDMPGAGGVVATAGGLPSTLEVGSTAGVQRSAGGGIVGRNTTPGGTADFGVGSAMTATLPGRLPARGTAAPTLAMNAQATGVGGGKAIGRSTTGMTQLGAAGVEATAIPEPGAGPAGTSGGKPGTGGQAGTNLLAGAAGPAEPATAVGRVTGGATTGLAGMRPGNGGPIGIPTGIDGGTLLAAPRVAAAATGSGGPPDGVEEGVAVGAVGGVKRTVTRPDIVGTAEPGEVQPIAVAVAPPGPTTGPAVTGPGDAAGLAPGAGSGPGTGPGTGGGRPQGGLAVQIAAEIGPGGLSNAPSADIGLPNRRARPESEVVHTVSRRFLIERSGGEVAIDGAVVESTGPYRQRDPGLRGRAAHKLGGSESTERAVEAGLDFFARTQFPDGHWSLDKLPDELKAKDAAMGQMTADTAATGLALLAYLGSGYTHLDDKHRTTVRRGLDWLIRHQKPNGDLFAGGTKYTWFYSHGIATIALCEAYGMTQDPELRGPARKAIGFIIKSQHPTRGGWRYEPGVESDTSVSGWQLMALKSAQMAGLDVPAEVFKKVDRWLDVAESEEGGGRYAYNPNAAPDREEQREGRKANLAMTAEGMLMRIYLGRKREDGGLVEGAEYLKQNLPQVGTDQQPLRDCYYWYYATQAMFQMQKDYWSAWNERLCPLLESSQATAGPLAGSWHPLKPVPDRWGPAGGRMYVTALNLLMLEVYYRHLPLFQELSK